MRRSLLLLPAVLLAAGCGGSPGSKSAGTTTAAPAASQTLEVVEKEFSITPAAINVARAATYSFAISNKGKIGHALVVQGQGIEQKTGTIAPGSSTSLSVTFAKPGKYELFCPIDGHRSKGMRATLTVGGAASSSGMNGTSPAPAPATTSGQTTTSQKGGYGY